MKFFFNWLTVSLLFIAFSTNAQNIKRCMHDEWMNETIKRHPKTIKLLEQQQAFLKAASIPSSTAAKGTGLVTIPVVFHIVLNSVQLSQIGGAAGVALRVDSQMAVLNRDFSGGSLDQAGIPSVFKPLYGNANIKFGLAHTKPDGTSTLGYIIKTTSQSSFSAVGGSVGSMTACSDAKYAITDGSDAWDPSKYLNIWIVNFTEGTLLGICPPMSWGVGGGFPIAEVGPAIHYKTFGKQGPGQSGFLVGYNGGRTLVHELGHFFELSHIWGNTPSGSGNCNDDDGINDTPKQEKDNSGCPSFPIPNCTNSNGGEMFMNYMDYVYDNCYKMFTIGQASVMNADVSTPSGYAYSLSQNPQLLQYPTAINTIKNDQAFFVFPNPATNRITIQVTEISKLEKITISNIMGQIVKQKVLNNSQEKIQEFDLAELPKGVYAIQCIFANGQLTKKIILQ